MEKSYTTSYSVNDDRFGFSRKGTFHCRLKNEITVIIIIIAASLLFAFILLLYLLKTQLFGGGLTAALWDYVVILLLIATPIACITLIRVARSGEEYRFTANEEKMLITCAKHDIRADIYYANVAGVDYFPIKNMSGNLIGYTVTMLCRDGYNFKFDFLFPQNMQIKSKDMTPFVIIEERAGLLEKPEFFAGRRIDTVDDYRR